MTSDTQKVADIQLNTDCPTELSFADLHTWVIWQFPQAIGDEKLCGAVKPPIPKHAWFAATIQFQAKRVQIFSHLTKKFTTPEMAAEHLQSTLNGSV